MMVVDCSEFVCPVCAGALQQASHRLTCSSCGTCYESLQGVPLLLAGLEVSDGASPHPDFLADLSRAAMPWSEGVATEAMRDVFSRRFTFQDQRLGAEGHRFLHRLKASGLAIREPYDDPAVAEPTRTPAGSKPLQSSVALSVVTAPTVVWRGQDFWVQVRITNNGAGTLRNTGDNALLLSSYTERRAPWPWRRQQRRYNARHSRLLIDLLPGQSMTQPVHIQALNRLGPVTYWVAPLIEQVEWLIELAMPVTVCGAARTGPNPLAVDWPYSPDVRNYHDDHVHGFELQSRWLQRRFGATTGLRVLELGGNATPILQTGAFGLQGPVCFNADIDPFGLAFGTVQRRLGGGPPIQDVVADGMQLPFADGSLDVIAMFATLHHFPDPVQLLRHLATKLSPKGVICVSCEPVGHVSHEALPADFRAELLDGICEQAFEPWEWKSLFDRAELRLVEVQHDCGSLKAMLARA